MTQQVEDLAVVVAEPQIVEVVRWSETREELTRTRVDECPRRPEVPVCVGADRARGPGVRAGWARPGNGGIGGLGQDGGNAGLFGDGGDGGDTLAFLARPFTNPT